MKTRIISGLVGTVLLFGVLLCPVPWVLAAVVAVAAAIAVWELLHNTGIVKSMMLTVGSMLYAAATAFSCSLDARDFGVPVAATPDYPMFEVLPLELLLILLAAYLLFVLVNAVLYRKAFVWKGFGLTMYATLGFSALVALRATDTHGLYYVLLPMVISWMSDTGAYFVGTFLGKHKMAPVISPKKSWEGFFGGWLISIGVTALYAYIGNTILGYACFNLIGVAVLAAGLAPLSVCGDLLASVIKRKSGIKDYGNLMPGHGGVMDRFDSVVFISLPVYIVLAFFGYLV